MPYSRFYNNFEFILQSILKSAIYNIQTKVGQNLQFLLKQPPKKSTNSAVYKDFSAKSTIYRSTAQKFLLVAMEAWAEGLMCAVAQEKVPLVLVEINTKLPLLSFNSRLGPIK